MNDRADLSKAMSHTRLRKTFHWLGAVSDLIQLLLIPGLQMVGFHQRYAVFHNTINLCNRNVSRFRNLLSHILEKPMASTTAIAASWLRVPWGKAIIAELSVVLSVSAIIRMVPSWE
jgi:hypothetical protein